MRKRLLIISILAFAMFGQVQVHSIADITGDGTTHQFTGDSRARWVLFQTPSTNTGTARIGDANVTTTRGEIIPGTSGIFWPPIGDQKDPTQFYDLTKLYYNVASSDKLVITWAR